MPAKVRTREYLTRIANKRGIGVNRPRVRERFIRLNEGTHTGLISRGIHYKASTRFVEQMRGDATIRGFAEVHGWDAARNLPKKLKYKVAGRKYMVTREVLVDWSPEWQERMFPCRTA